MNEILTLGRDKSNDVVLPGSDVSKFHASLRLDAEQNILIEDLDSTNGTFVNGRKIKLNKITATDQVLIGKTEINQELLSKSIESLAHKNNIYTKEFTDVLQASKKYEKQKSKINKNLKGVLMRVLLSAAIILVFSLIPGLDITVRIILMSVVTPAILVFIDNSPEKKQHQLDELRLKYEESIKCPKCNTSLINFSTTYLNGKRVCQNPKCKAIWQL